MSSAPHRFKPGRSGNPGGAPKGILRRIRERHGADVDKILEICVKLARGEDLIGYEDIEPRDRLKACTIVLDRVIGKPKEHVEITEGASPPSLDFAELSNTQIDALIALAATSPAQQGDDGGGGEPH